MVGPSSRVSKGLVTLLVLLLLYYAFMDYNLFFRIKNYPVGDAINGSSYGYVSWIGCDVNPLCDVTVKAVLLDHTNLYVFAPFVTLFDDVFQVSAVRFITPNAISCFHIGVAVASAWCVAGDRLASRRVGVVLFELRTCLDDLDGYVARKRKHVKGEHSDVGTVGYYVDGICDAIGCAALLVGMLWYLRNNPPRRGYVQLPSTDVKPRPQNVVTKLGCFTSQLVISSIAWNRYIALYQNLLETGDAPGRPRRDAVFESTVFFAVSFLWRMFNVHNMLHCALLAIFCDKLWEFLCHVQYVGYAVLLCVICVTEAHYVHAKAYVLSTVR
ncbi:ceramide phosphoethanolamine synthase [Cylas formicarius]|uniref:ceramide phosphoethanolamine synthase n=1 Tax=Cylas formicarius TaxID=197179 RepID=UPI002958D023|nr:ceramide phosphoethanolamine synthase [Cylas formicarius]XP_060520315.1 ceramide phosphoethanolamine synthase [Cylas formicarius]